MVSTSVVSRVAAVGAVILSTAYLAASSKASPFQEHAEKISDYRTLADLLDEDILEEPSDHNGDFVWTATSSPTPSPSATIPITSPTTGSPISTTSPIPEATAPASSSTKAPVGQELSAAWRVSSRISTTAAATVLMTVCLALLS